MGKYIDDLLHVAWGAWIVACFAFLPPVLAAVAAILPREAEQTWHALDAHTWEDFRAHINQKWAVGKLRDIAGFAVGAAILAYLLGV